MTDRWRYVCPECHATRIRSRVEAEPKYKCRTCGATFDLPLDRKTGERRTRYSETIA
jgi:DNA-directed RNA polymerase subunit RPC12/RpoP